jgi:hypothetical protein
LEKTEGAIKDGQSRDTNIVGQKTTDEDKQNIKPRHKKLKRSVNLDIKHWRKLRLQLWKWYVQWLPRGFGAVIELLTLREHLGPPPPVTIQRHKHCRTEDNGRRQTKHKTTTQKIKEMSSTNPTVKPGVGGPRCSRRVSSSITAPKPLGSHCTYHFHNCNRSFLQCLISKLTDCLFLTAN